MNTTTTRIYHFSAAELHAIKVFCQLADNIVISENVENNNSNYSAEEFFYKKYEEYSETENIIPTFQVGD